MNRNPDDHRGITGVPPWAQAERPTKKKSGDPVVRYALIIALVAVVGLYILLNYWWPL